LGSERAPVRRVHVLGGPGSGKTTLARALVVRLGAPAHNLDAVAYERGAGAKRPLEARLADARRIAAGSSWVAEGIYLGWTAELSAAADLVVWLDPPWPVAARRIVLRHLRASLAGTNRHRGLGKLWRFLLGARRHYLAAQPVPDAAPDDDHAVSRAATAAYLAAYWEKVVRCRTQQEVSALLRRLG